jgi:endonuclease YncB( thermonuclease family)
MGSMSARDLLVAACFLLLILLIAMKIERDREAILEGTFVVVDGDSLRQGDMRLRLKGIDAPELGQDCQRDGVAWACGRQARDALAALVARPPGLSCRGAGQDRYGRLLVRCTNGDLDIGHAMVKTGMAVAYGDYEAEETVAKAGQTGIWSGVFETPKHWRSRHGRSDQDDKGDFSSFLGGLFGVE